MEQLKSPTQPHCRWCAKPLRKWTSTVRLAHTEADLPVERYRHGRWLVANPRSKTECQKLVNEKVVSVQIRWKVDYDEDTRADKRRADGYYSFNTWDGESYEVFWDYFCSGTCAMKLGYAAVRDHQLGSRAYIELMAKKEKEKINAA